ncbi:ATP-binding protein [Colwellia sp. 1_MG-2023]|uniref:sensor histidine kinase n=1 Tax=Colwellia sp. 1_MG-2023 TaxID=3062649 RepID=UPI0026E3DAF1|nr:ATP-binding protein [Colwellia sp. 1_MG-2023]MDO6447187.1 ATP-binding protein [Colwellia sp. 1_MG-2023]
MKKPIKKWELENALRFSSVRQFSIKSLTLIGFSLVVLPLTFALLYGANQVNKLSQQGSSAIINVAELVKINRQLSIEINKLQRFASQYVVLEDQSLYAQFVQQKNKLTDIITTDIVIYQDEQLNQLSQQLLTEIKQLHLYQPNSENLNKHSLDMLQEEFKALASVSQMINFRSNELISSHAQNMKNSADSLRTTMLNSLVSIPLTIVIAVVFILLIIRPLRQLSAKIYRLEQGHFQQKITFSGSKEIKEIADALELMRARLHALELQKSSFIRHISHELKTPLAAIREGTELLYDNSVGALNDDQQEITNILKISVSRLQNLIEDLLDFNIVLDSTSLQDAEKSQLTPIIEQSINDRKLDIQSKQLSVQSDLSPLNVQTNVKQLSVILDNILSNAIKYSPQGGEIHIHSYLENHEIILKITDQGPGIDPKAQQQVFDAFYQGTPPSDSNIKSSGLGLTIVKELLMRLSGDIELTSLAAPKHGLIVTLRFPYHNQGK